MSQIHLNERPARGNEDFPLFSMCIVTFNQRHLVEECIDSVLKQDYPNIELLIYDDESSDFDVGEVTGYIDAHKRENIRNVIVHKQEHNVGTTRNCIDVIAASGGELFKLHAGDDMLWDEHTISSVVGYFKNDSVNVLIARARACTYEGEVLDHVYPRDQYFAKCVGASPEQLFDYIGTEPWGAYVCAPAAFYRRSLYEKVGGFNPDYKYTEDWPMWLKICKLGYEMTYVDKITTIYRYGGISNSMSETNRALGIPHYEECVRMLKEMAYPEYEAKKNRYRMFRCWYSWKCISFRIIKETEWVQYDALDKLLFRIRNIPYFFLTRLHWRGEWNQRLPMRREAGLAAILFVLLFAYLFGELFFGASLDRNVIYFLSLSFALTCAFALGRMLINLVIAWAGSRARKQ